MDIEINKRAEDWYQPLFREVKVNLEFEIILDEKTTVQELVNNIISDVEYESLTTSDFCKIKVVRATQLLEKKIELK
tara:strand:+ start:591 stop:821 length:231 start_codon:yes stop_codon:yes gene_type:complete